MEDPKKEGQIELYLQKIRSYTQDLYGERALDLALRTLCKSNYDVDLAFKNFKGIPFEEMSGVQWSQEEKSIFRKNLADYGKKFHLFKPSVRYLLSLCLFVSKFLY